MPFVCTTLLCQSVLNLTKTNATRFSVGFCKQCCYCRWKYNCERYSAVQKLDRYKIRITATNILHKSVHNLHIICTSFLYGKLFWKKQDFSFMWRLYLAVAYFQGLSSNKKNPGDNWSVKSVVCNFPTPILIQMWKKTDRQNIPKHQPPDQEIKQISSYSSTKGNSKPGQRFVVRP